MTTHEEHEVWMRRALELARRGEGCTRPNPPVGAIVVRNGVEVGAGYHREAGGPHAEVWALRAAGERARGATLYVTLEPCSTFGRTPPCTDLIIRSGISRVVAAMRDPNPLHRGRGLTILRRKGVQVITGPGREEARRLLAPFAKWITTGRPYITVKLGLTFDGRIADESGKSKWITGPSARSIVRRLRCRADAILVGARTARIDNPHLLCGKKRPVVPYRIVVTASGHISAQANLLSDKFVANTIIVTGRNCPSSRIRSYKTAGAQVWVLPSKSGRIQLQELASRLGKIGLLHVLCEGGAELAGELIRSGLVDEFVFFVAPTILGGWRALPAITGRGWPLATAPRLRFEEVSRAGRDILIRAVPLCDREKSKRKSKRSRQ